MSGTNGRSEGATGAVERMIAAAVAAGAGADVVAALRAAGAAGDVPEVRTSAKDGRNVELAFERKPSADVLAELKGARFRWSPTARVWYGRAEALPARFAGLGTVAPVKTSDDHADAPAPVAKAAPTMPAGAVPILDLISRPKAARGVATTTARPVAVRKDVGAGQWG